MRRRNETIPSLFVVEFDLVLGNHFEIRLIAFLFLTKKLRFGMSLVVRNFEPLRLEQKSDFYYFLYADRIYVVSVVYWFYFKIAFTYLLQNQVTTLSKHIFFEKVTIFLIFLPEGEMKPFLHCSTQNLTQFQEIISKFA